MAIKLGEQQHVLKKDNIGETTLYNWCIIRKKNCNKNKNDSSPTYYASLTSKKNDNKLELYIIHLSLHITTQMARSRRKVVS